MSALTSLDEANESTYLLTVGDGVECANITDEASESNKQRRMRYLSLAISFWGIFVCWLQDSMFCTSLWPYLSKIDKTVTPAFFGIVVSCYGIGMTLSNPLMGLWSSRLKTIRIPVVTCLMVNIAGNLLLCFAESFNGYEKYAVLVSRLIVGISGGALGPLSAYGADATFPDERNKMTSYQAASISLACILGPGLQAVMSLLGYPGVVIGQFRLNMYTLTGYLSVLLSFCTILLIIFVHKEFNVGIRTRIDELTSTVIDEEPESLDIVAIFACIWCRFILIFCVVYDDTIGSIFSMIMFNWSRSQALVYNGLLNIAGGVLDLANNIFVGAVLLKHIRERNLIIVGLFSYLMFYIISFSYPGLPIIGEVTLCPTSYNDTDSAISLKPMYISHNNNTINAQCFIDANLDRTVCSYDWCKDTTRIHLWSYVVAFLFMYLAASTCFAPSMTLFTKVIGQRRQALWQGLIMGAQSIGVTISPIMVSSIFALYGPRSAWFVGSGLILASIIFMFASYKRLLPHKNYGQQFNVST